MTSVHVHVCSVCERIWLANIRPICQNNRPKPLGVFGSSLHIYSFTKKLHISFKLMCNPLTVSFYSLYFIHIVRIQFFYFSSCKNKCKPINSVAFHLYDTSVSPGAVLVCFYYNSFSLEVDFLVPWDT